MTINDNLMIFSFVALGLADCQLIHKTPVKQSNDH